MWNAIEINLQEKYVKERLKRVKDYKELEKLELTLAAYFNVLYGTDKIKYNRVYRKACLDRDNTNFIERKQATDIVCYNRFVQNDSYLDDHYMLFLTQLASNLVNIEVDEEFYLSCNGEISEKKLFDVSKNFFDYLGDSELKTISDKMLKSKNQIHFCDFFYENMIGLQGTYGITVNDYVFNKSYLVVSKTNTIFDYQAFTHEVTHAIDNKLCQKLPSENYYGFHEVCTYTMDYLFFDYLEQSGFDLDEVNSLKKIRYNYIKELAVNSIKSLENSKISNSKDLRKESNFILLKNLLELESMVIAYILYNQIKENKEYGLENLKKLMKNIIPKNAIPDFSFIGIDDNMILQNSNMMGDYLSKQKSSRQNK